MLACLSMILPSLLFVFYIDHLAAMTYKVPVQLACIPSIKLELHVSRGSQVFQECWPMSQGSKGDLLLLMDRCRLMMGV